MRIRLHDRGYRLMCDLVDERDGGRCVICGSPYVQHHHIKFRSGGGSDTPDNLVCLCAGCHAIYAHGKKSKSWQAILMDYVNDVKFDEFYAKHLKDMRAIIKRYGKTKRIRLMGGDGDGGGMD